MMADKNNEKLSFGSNQTFSTVIHSQDRENCLWCMAEMCVCVSLLPPETVTTIGYEARVIAD